jgi:acetyl-CoA C-acetyltransferase
MSDIVIVSAARTPVGSFNGALSSLPAHELGAIAIKAAAERAGVPVEEVEEVILGQVLQAGAGQGPARQAAIKAGVPVSSPGWSINQLCGSGLRAVALGAQQIQDGSATVVVAGGQESMSQSPHAAHLRNGTKMGDLAIDTMIKDGLWDAFHGYHMGQTAENIAARWQITREDQDRFAVSSRNRAEAAQKAGRFADEIAPVTLKTRKGESVVDQDEYVRHGVRQESVSSLKPAFTKDGSVTAGNASGINDGAAALVLMSEAEAARRGLKPLARIASWAHAGVDPDAQQKQEAKVGSHLHPERSRRHPPRSRHRPRRRCRGEPRPGLDPDADGAGPGDRQLGGAVQPKLPGHLGGVTITPSKAPENRSIFGMATQPYRRAMGSGGSRQEMDIPAAKAAPERGFRSPQTPAEGSGVATPSKSPLSRTERQAPWRLLESHLDVGSRRRPAGRGVRGVFRLALAGQTCGVSPPLPASAAGPTGSRERLLPPAAARTSGSATRSSGQSPSGAAIPLPPHGGSMPRDDLVAVALVRLLRKPKTRIGTASPWGRAPSVAGGVLSTLNQILFGVCPYDD